VIRLGPSAAQGATAIANGTADFMANLGQIPGDAAYFRHHRGQLQINPFMATGYMFLNVNAPPFKQLRVHQALNLALDRQQIVNGYGDTLNFIGSIAGSRHKAAVTNRHENLFC
jgi:ABC-type transport system substrate-binding protein